MVYFQIDDVSHWSIRDFSGPKMTNVAVHFWQFLTVFAFSKEIGTLWV